MRWIILSFFYLIFSNVAFSGEIVLSGAYQGRDIFVQNPYNRAASGFCTQAVFVNDRLVLESPKVSAFKIDLSYLRTNDLVVIRIEHLEGCRPTIINPQVLHPVDNFQFLSAEVDHNSIRWATSGEKESGQFAIEQEQENAEWTIIDRVVAKEELQGSQYAVSTQHHKGENKYRVMYETDEGFQAYSLELYYTQTDTLITFRPQIVTSQITLSDSANYQVFDFQGKVIKKGVGREIFLSDLKPGEYYLEIQNRKEKFIKR
ncbi:T9SS type A sorting domain-containing protein [Fulvivirga sp. M361]|uniref:T9SS type A sorting domain-containing protein n=1 Tax=Fulvivirga sp. M361 TaxID=2594266 RepID=UPI00117B1124|nr:T9SS type A sorting domain-containing protein [Fulvivirga sp. M361]TRX49496.1 T9SS type A sorting domain-containing protein [Fulvivirga sp. M361]